MLVRDLGNLFKIKEMPIKRMLFEGIIPEIADLLGLKASSEYQDILIGLLEVPAEANGVERFRIYTMEEFIDEIKAYMEGKGKLYIRMSRLKKEKGLNLRLADILKRRNRLNKAARSIIDVLQINNESMR